MTLTEIMNKIKKLKNELSEGITITKTKEGIQLDIIIELNADLNAALTYLKNFGITTIKEIHTTKKYHIVRILLPIKKIYKNSTNEEKLKIIAYYVGILGEND